jgi:deoxyuridine 5'-triphosphate nucleotidohydrolase
MPILKFKKLHPKAIVPKYQTKGSSGFDLHSIVDSDNECYSKIGNPLNLNEWNDTLVVPSRSQCIVRTGLAVVISKGYEMQIRPRSGLAFNHSITITNSPGTIDCVPGDTKIQTPYGDITAAEVFDSSESVVIYSYNENKMEIEKDRIVDIWLVNNLKLLEIETEGGTIIVPEDKEIMTKKGWCRAADLDENDKILSFI